MYLTAGLKGLRGAPASSQQHASTHQRVQQLPPQNELVANRSYRLCLVLPQNPEAGSCRGFVLPLLSLPLRKRGPDAASGSQQNPRG